VAKFPDNVVMLTISNDLPFAQKRFCKVENIDNVKVLSDAVWRDFGNNYGLLIKDMGLLTRAIFIIDDKGTVAYKELVANISNHPNYEAALAKLKVMSTPVTLDKSSSKNTSAPLKNSPPETPVKSTNN
jgi:thiol peroxidase